MSTFSQPSHPRAALAAALIIAAGAVLAYHNSFSVPFIFDDDSSIKGNPSIRSLLTAWSPPAGGGHTVSGRPFLNFTLALNYLAGGTAVRGYHWVNLLIHIAAGCTLFGVVRRTLAMPLCRRLFTGDSRRAPSPDTMKSPVNRLLPADAFLLAFAVAVLWTLHPLQTQAVTYIVQRAESLVSLLYLLTIWCFIRATESSAPRKWAGLAWVACLLGMATKEVMVSAPLMVLLYDRIFAAGAWREVWKSRGRLHLALAGTWLLLAWLVVSTAGRGGTAGLGTPISPWSYACTQFAAVTHYLWLALWPRPLVFDYGKSLVAGFGDVWWQAMLLGSLALGSAWGAWRGRPWGWLGVGFFAVLVPSSSVIPVLTQTMSEHRFYLALAFVITVVVVGLFRLAGRASLLLWALVAVALGATTVRRNHDYRSELALWEDTVVKRPGNTRALAALAALHQAAGRLEAARGLLQEAVRLAPDSVEAVNNLGNAWMKAGNWEDAARCFQHALELQPSEPYALNNLGNARLQVGRTAEAIRHFEAAIRAKPDFLEPRFNLANTLAQTGRMADALTHYDYYLRLKPEDVEARSNYAATLQMTRRFDDAVMQLRFAVKLRPADAELQNNLGAALAQAGRPAEAIPHFQEALRLRPDFTGARENLARATGAASDKL